MIAPEKAFSCSHAHNCEITAVDPTLLANAQQALSRRMFVRTFALFSAASWLGGTELKSLLVAEVAAQSSSLPGIFKINLDNFPTHSCEQRRLRAHRGDRHADLLRADHHFTGGK